MEEEDYKPVANISLKDHYNDQVEFSGLCDTGEGRCLDFTVACMRQLFSRKDFYDRLAKGEDVEFHLKITF